VSGIAPALRSASAAEKPSLQGWVIAVCEMELLSLQHIRGLRTFLAFDDLKFDTIAFLQALVPLCNQGTVMHEHIGPVVTANKPKPFSVVEPFYGSFQFHFLFLRGRQPAATIASAVDELRQAG
jgi:hypothetical protein